MKTVLAVEFLPILQLQMESAVQRAKQNKNLASKPRCHILCFTFILSPPGKSSNKSRQMAFFLQSQTLASHFHSTVLDLPGFQVSIQMENSWAKEPEAQVFAKCSWMFLSSPSWDKWLHEAEPCIQETGQSWKSLMHVCIHIWRLKGNKNRQDSWGKNQIIN